jgi:hypothetical protein
VGVALQPVAVKCLGVKPFETVEQLPSPPLALVEVLGVCAAEEPICLCSMEAIIAVIAIIAFNAKLNLCILAGRIPTIRVYSEDCYSLFSE